MVDVAQTHAVALEVGGLQVGVDQGLLFDEACGLSNFLIPYQRIAPYLSTFGDGLASGFRAEPLDQGFPWRMAQALSYVARRTTVPVEGPTDPGTYSGVPPSMTATATANSYDVGFNYCPHPWPLNSRNIDHCPQGNTYIWGGFGAQRFRSVAAARRSLLACDAWTCEVRTQLCGVRAKVRTIERQRIRLCDGMGQWRRGSWLFIVTQPTPGNDGYITQVLDEERSISLPRGIGVLQDDPGGDNNNTVISWAVGAVVYSVYEYFGGGLDVASSFRPFVR
jgi:hypothetical protein